MRLENEAALEWFRKEGMSARELAFLRSEIESGADLRVDTFEGATGLSDAKAMFPDELENFPGVVRG